MRIPRENGQILTLKNSQKFLCPPLYIPNQLNMYQSPLQITPKISPGGNLRTQNEVIK